MGDEILADPPTMRLAADDLRRIAAEVGKGGDFLLSETADALSYDGQYAPWVQAITGEGDRRARLFSEKVEGLARTLDDIALRFENADSLKENGLIGWAKIYQGLIDAGADTSTFPWWLVRGQKPPWLTDSFWNHLLPEDRDAYLASLGGAFREFAASGDYTHGSAADTWNAFIAWLYLHGQLGAPPAEEVWRSAAKAAGKTLEEYLSEAAGIPQNQVEAWFRAAETHDFSQEFAIHEIAAMAKAGETIEEHFGFSIEGNWTDADKDDIVEGVLMVSHAMAGATPDADTAAEVFRSVFDGIGFRLDPEGPPDRWNCTGGGSEVSCLPRARDRISPHTVAHELAHTFNARVVNHMREELGALELAAEDLARLRQRAVAIGPYGDLGREEIVAEINGEAVHVAGPPLGGGYERTDLGYATAGAPMQQHPLGWGEEGDTSGNTPNEDFADMFLGWAYDGFADDAAGRARYGWMESHMAEWIEQGSQPIDLAWFGDGVP